MLTMMLTRFLLHCALTPSCTVSAPRRTEVRRLHQLVRHGLYSSQQVGERLSRKEALIGNADTGS